MAIKKGGTVESFVPLPRMAPMLGDGFLSFKRLQSFHTSFRLEEIVLRL